MRCRSSYRPCPKDMGHPAVTVTGVVVNGSGGSTSSCSSPNTDDVTLTASILPINNFRFILPSSNKIPYRPLRLGAPPRCTSGWGLDDTTSPTLRCRSSYPPPRNEMGHPARSGSGGSLAAQSGGGAALAPGYCRAGLQPAIPPADSVTASSSCNSPNTDDVAPTARILPINNFPLIISSSNKFPYGPLHAGAPSFLKVEAG